MRVFAVSCLVALGIALGAAVVLSFVQQTADVAFSTTGARI
jgi:hypothetical protein